MALNPHLSDSLTDGQARLLPTSERSVRRESLHVKGFEGNALGNPAFHVLPFMVLESEASTPRVG
jgi:hypothetical protein